jgi:metallo-beta-lactamase family protein
MAHLRESRSAPGATAEAIVGRVTTNRGSLTFMSLGGASTVTGSKHLLEHEGRRILVDSGLFQGVKNLRELNWAKLPVAPTTIDAVVLTHAHLDHTGYLPRLVKEGFAGPVFATAATRDVADLILRDSAHIQENDAAFLNRIGKSKHKPALPLYTEADAVRAIQRIETVPFGEEFEVLGGRTDAARATFRRAGHILGAATVDLTWAGRRVVFSGDLGRYGDPLMPDPDPVPAADYVVVESTYGDRLHDPIDPAAELHAIAERTLARGGTLLIPAFAVGRSQSLLHWFWQLRRDGLLDASVPIYLDSPMAINATELLHAHPDDHRLAAGLAREVCSIATYTRDPEESMRISGDRKPKIVISASGMATGGRILHHLKAFGPDQRNTILLAGYQSVGTRGRSLQEGGRDLKLYGEWIHINAEVASLASLSAHGDADELMRWLGGFTHRPRQAFVVHGEPQASETFRSRINRELGWQAVVPRPQQVFGL